MTSPRPASVPSLCRACQSPSGACQCGPARAPSPLHVVQSEASPRLVPPNGAALRRNLVALARREHARWNPGGRARTELEPALRAVLADYWQRGAGASFSEQQLASPQFQKRFPWSAAFISWLMRQAGAGKAFRYSAKHAEYILAAKQNRLQNNGNPIRAYRASEARPEVGDIVCKSRSGSGATYDNLRPDMNTHCDVVVARNQHQLSVIGGNVSDSVALRSVPLNAQGLLAPPEYFAVLKVGATNPVSPQPVPAPPAPSAPARPTPVTPGPRRSPIGRTYYAPIDLGITLPSGPVPRQTGIFIPTGWQPGAQVDLVIYLHGIRDPRTTVESYWDRSKNPAYALREEFAASGKNAILVAPLLGPRSQSQIGRLARPSGLDHLAGSVLQVLRQRGELRLPARPRHIILACHSGGGLAMRLVASAPNALRPAIRECWGFDCTYNHDDARVWGGWARARRDARLYLYYRPGFGTEKQSVLLQRQQLPNVQVLKSSASHPGVPRAHLRERLHLASFLAARRTGS